MPEISGSVFSMRPRLVKTILVRMGPWVRQRGDGCYGASCLFRSRAMRLCDSAALPLCGSAALGPAALRPWDTAAPLPRLCGSAYTKPHPIDGAHTRQILVNVSERGSQPVTLPVDVAPGSAGGERSVPVPACA